MWILVIVLYLSTDKSDFTYIEREARLSFSNAQQCEAELERWFLHDGVNVGDVAELPEAEGNPNWIASYAECRHTTAAEI